MELQWRSSLQALTLGTRFPSGEGAGGQGLGWPPSWGHEETEAQEKPGRGVGHCRELGFGQTEAEQEGTEELLEQGSLWVGSPTCTHAQAHRHAQARARI